MSGGRKLKYHEERLLRKTDFLSWRGEENLRFNALLRRYHIEEADDLLKYQKLCGLVTSLIAKLRALPATSAIRVHATQQLLQKLYSMGLLPTAATALPAERDIKAAAFCRRRLPIVLVRLKMAQTVRAAVELVRHGHVRIGPEVVTDPAFLVTRSMQDHVTWVDSSKIKRAVAAYNDKLDDFELLGV